MTSFRNENGLSIDEVIELRLDIVVRLFGWGDARVAGFKAGFSDYRADSIKPASARKHVSDAHGFDEKHMPRDVAAALGYKEGISAARSMTSDDPSSMMPCSRDEILQEVSLWSANGNGDFEIDDAEWIADIADKTDRFLAIMSLEEWTEWLRDEHVNSIESGQAGYAQLILEDIQTPVVYVEYDASKLDPWDGWHRIGAALVKGAGVIPSIRGVPSPDPAPRP
jgi:hypothetical protein